MSDNTTNSTADYLAQLLKDRKQLSAFPSVFLHVERLLEEEITRVRGNLFQISGGVGEPMVLPEPEGETVSLSEKVYVPQKDHPDFNFVGRILGPRGMTAKQLEHETCCKIMVRGKGSMRDKNKEDQNRGKPNWEHLNDDLHVLITVEDTENRAKIKLKRAIEEVKKLLVPTNGNDGEDELKKRQLMELAIINGTYRHSYTRNGLAMQQDIEALGALSGEMPRFLAAASGHFFPAPLRQGTALSGHPLILPAPRISIPTSSVGGNPLPPPPCNPVGVMPPLVPVTSETGGIFYASPYPTPDYSGLTLAPAHDYHHHHDPTGAQNLTSVKPKNPRSLDHLHSREHPYRRQ